MSERERKGLLNIGAAVVLGVLGGMLYTVGMLGDGTNWTFLQFGFSGVAIGGALLLSGVATLLIPDEKYYDIADQVGFVTLGVAVVYFNIWYPNSWHIAEPADIGFPITAVGMGLFLIGYAGVLTPLFIKVKQDVETEDNWYYAGIILVPLSFVVSLIGIGMYGYSQLFLPFPLTDDIWLIRTLGFGFMGITPLVFFLGVTCLVPATEKAKAIGAGTTFIGSLLVFGILLAFYPDQWHTSGNVLTVVSSVLAITTCFVLLLLTTLSGVVRYEEEIDLDLPYTSDSTPK